MPSIANRSLAIVIPKAQGVLKLLARFDAKNTNHQRAKLITLRELLG
jgi:hypothetical protein